MLLAGTAVFILREIMPKLSQSKGNMLAIARMFMNWLPEEMLAIIKENNFPYDVEFYKKIKATPNNYFSKDFFKLLCFKNYDDIDFDPTEGCSILHDMNVPLEEKYRNRYDFVFENGTIEHIFNINVAVASMASAVKVGGYVLHISPLDAFNHGFYNFSINFFADFYRVNGFGDMKFYLLRASSDWQSKNEQDVKVEPLSYTADEFGINPEIYQSKFNKLGIAFFAKKNEHVFPVITPIQAAYDKKLRLNEGGRE